MTERLALFFALIAVGWFIRRRGVMSSAGVRDLIRLIIDVLMPALTFTSTALNLTPAVAGLDRWFAGPLLGMPLLAIGVCLAGVILGYALLPLTGLKGERAVTFVFLIGFANSSFLPIPLSYALYGELGVLYVMLYLFGWMLLFWTYGMKMIRGRPEFKFLVHPQMLALYFGAAVGLSSTHVPELVAEMLKLIGGSAVPLALLCVGCVMAEQGVDVARDWRPVTVMTVGKMLILPAAAVAAVRAGWLGEPLGSLAVLQAAMPCMAQAALYVVRFGGDTKLAGSASFVTTLAAAATVPLFLGLIK